MLAGGGVLLGLLGLLLAFRRRGAGLGLSLGGTAVCGSVLFSIVVLLAKDAGPDGLLEKLKAAVQGKGSKETGKPSLPGLQGNEEQVILAHLRRNAADPASVDIAECGDPRLVLMVDEDREAADASKPKEEGGSSEKVRYVPGVIMRVRWRENNSFGAKFLREGMALIQGGKVAKLSILGEGETRGMPRDMALRWALRWIGTRAAERFDGKMTLAIIRGKIKYQGAPVTGNLSVYFNKEGGANEGELEDVLMARVEQDVQKQHGREDRAYGLTLHARTAAPRFEVAGVSPGKYLVTVEWGEGWKAALSCVISDGEQTQTYDFDVTNHAVREYIPLTQVRNSPPPAKSYVFRQQLQNGTWLLDLSVTDQRNLGGFLGHEIKARAKNISDRARPAGNLLFSVHFSGGWLFGANAETPTQVSLVARGGVLQPGEEMPLEVVKEGGVGSGTLTRPPDGIREAIQLDPDGRKPRQKERPREEED
jgi:hypothetical protein